MRRLQFNRFQLQHNIYCKQLFLVTVDFLPTFEKVQSPHTLFLFIRKIHNFGPVCDVVFKILQTNLNFLNEI